MANNDTGSTGGKELPPGAIITQEEFATQGLALSQEAKVVDTLHSYFVVHCPRLYQACRWFHLLEGKLGDVLEIGPFFGYTPFVLRPRAASYVVLEGDDPVVHALKPLYRDRKIEAQFVDLFDMFGPTDGASHSLGFNDNSFDTVLCWETMEHFNFNPVKFVRELWRILKPGGRVCITVPNKASLQAIIALIAGRQELKLIDAYYQYEDYVVHGKKAFYGFHWREYARPELQHLFAKAGFKVRQCDTVTAFQANPNRSVLRQAVRGANRWVTGVLRRYGTHVCLSAEK